MNQFLTDEVFLSLGMLCVLLLLLWLVWFIIELLKWDRRVNGTTLTKQEKEAAQEQVKIDDIADLIEFQRKERNDRHNNCKPVD